MKILVNGCYGGFRFSDEFMQFANIKSIYDIRDNEHRRADADLIAKVEEFGLENASGICADLEIAEIPDDATDYKITEYDGIESVIYVLDGKIYYAE